MSQENSQKTSQQNKKHNLLKKLQEILERADEDDLDSLITQKDSTVFTTPQPVQDTVDSIMNYSHRSSIDTQASQAFQSHRSSIDTQASQASSTTHASMNTRPPIPKPKGNYINIPKTLEISKPKHNDYQNHIRDLVKLHVDLNKEYKKQSPKTIELVTIKFKKRNQDFPDTINDWAIKMMIKRVINNIRDYRRKGKEGYKASERAEDKVDKENEVDKEGEVDKEDEVDEEDKEEEDKECDINTGEAEQKQKTPVTRAKRKQTNGDDKVKNKKIQLNRPVRKSSKKNHE